MKTRPTCVFTVVSATNISAPISWSDEPRAMGLNTSRSRSVSCSTAASAAAFAEDGPAPASVRLATMRSIQWQGRLPRSHRWCRRGRRGRRGRRCRRSCRAGSRSGHGHRWTATAATRIAARRKCVIGRVVSTNESSGRADQDGHGVTPSRLQSCGASSVRAARKTPRTSCAHTCCLTLDSWVEVTVADSYRHSLPEP